MLFRSKSKKKSSKPEAFVSDLLTNDPTNRYQEVKLKSWKKFGFTLTQGKSGQKKQLVTDPKKIAILESSIPRLKQKRSFKVNGGLFLLMIAICSTIFFIAWALAAGHVYAIGIGSSTKGNWSELFVKIFFFLSSNFWSGFIFKNEANFYGFFSSLVENFTAPTDAPKIYLATGVYFGLFAAIIQLTIITIWLIISLFQKNNRNFWICLFCLLPVISIFVSVYFLGVSHYENTYLAQRLINKTVQVEEKANTSNFSLNNEFKFPEINGEVFKYSNPIGN